MRIYVDELPKSCIGCPFCQDIKVNAGMDRLLFCKANKGKAIKNIEKSFDKCIVKNEFQILADYTKQVRKEVIEQVKDYMENHSHTIPVDTKNRKVVYKIGLTRFLDQIQGETKC